MDTLQQIPLNELTPDPNQPRKDFDQDLLNELAASIKAVGVIQPIRVRLNPDFPGSGTRYMIIAGERRWQASKIAGKESIQSVVVCDEESLTDEAIYAHQLTENLHRQDLNPVEKAEFISGRIEYLKGQGITNAVEQTAAELGVSPSWISKNTQILKYEPEIRALARDGKLRDYAVLKKLSTLRPAKRQEAIELIEKGEFVAKEFFGRKRYEKKDDQEDKKESESVSQAKSASRNSSASDIKLQLSVGQVVKLIEKTDYASLLERHDQNWKNAEADVIKQYWDKFKEWFTEQ